MHTLLDLRGNIHSFIKIANGKVGDVNILDELIPEPGPYYVVDQAYLDYPRLYTLGQCPAFFVTRAKRNLPFRRVYYHPVDLTIGVKSDQAIVLTGFYVAKDYPDQLLSILFFDIEKRKILLFHLNNFSLPWEGLALFYKSRWHIELFFKWIKQHLGIKVFFGTSENAFKTQIWIAISVSWRRFSKTSSSRLETPNNSTVFEHHRFRERALVANTYQFQLRSSSEKLPPFRPDTPVADSK